MNALVVGYGSIGKRHIVNLLRLDSVDQIFVYTKIKNHLAGGCEKLYFIDASMHDLGNVADRHRIDFAIIANETYKHINTSITLAENGVHLFIEKPLSHNLNNIGNLRKLACQKGIKIFVAYNLRFLPAIKYVAEKISKGIIGDLYFSQIEAGQYLPSWRANNHYTKSYSSKTECGGGVSLDLSHEVDYMRFLFGDPFMWKTVRSKVSDLEINCDDIFEGIYKFHSGFTCTIHLDYLQRSPKRIIRIFGSKGEIVCNLIEKRIVIQSTIESSLLTEDSFFDVADTYSTELSHFIAMIQSEKEPLLTIDDGIKALELLIDYHD